MTFETVVQYRIPCPLYREQVKKRPALTPLQHHAAGCTCGVDSGGAWQYGWAPLREILPPKIDEENLI